MTTGTNSLLKLYGIQMLTEKQKMATLQFLEKVNNSLENFSKLDILTKTSITKVCQEIGISRQAFYQFVEYVEELKK